MSRAHFPRADLLRASFRENMAARRGEAAGWRINAGSSADERAAPTRGRRKPDIGRSTGAPVAGRFDEEQFDRAACSPSMRIEDIVRRRLRRHSACRSRAGEGLDPNQVGISSGWQIVGHRCSGHGGKQWRGLAWRGRVLRRRVLCCDVRHGSHSGMRVGAMHCNGRRSGASRAAVGRPYIGGRINRSTTWMTRWRPRCPRGHRGIVHHHLCRLRVDRKLGPCRWGPHCRRSGRSTTAPARPGRSHGNQLFLVLGEQQAFDECPRAARAKASSVGGRR